MKPPISSEDKSQTITFSLKPELFRLMLKQVKELGYPWTRSSYVANLVIKDLTAAGLISLETDTALTPGTGNAQAKQMSSDKKVAMAKKAVENAKNIASQRGSGRAKAPGKGVAPVR